MNSVYADWILTLLFEKWESYYLSQRIRIRNKKIMLQGITNIVKKTSQTACVYQTIKQDSTSFTESLLHIPHSRTIMQLILN